MLTLIRGKSNKSKYMTTLFRGVQNSVLINTTKNYFPCEDEHSFVVPGIDQNLVVGLQNIIDWATNKNNYQTIFIYANINPLDVGKVKEWYDDYQIRVDVFITVRSVSERYVIIEECIL